MVDGGFGNYLYPPSVSGKPEPLTLVPAYGVDTPLTLDVPREVKWKESQSQTLTLGVPREVKWRESRSPTLTLVAAYGVSPAEGCLCVGIAHVRKAGEHSGTHGHLTNTNMLIMISRK